MINSIQLLEKSISLHQRTLKFSVKSPGQEHSLNHQAIHTANPLDMGKELWIMSKFSRREFLKISSLFFAGTGATLLVDRALAQDRLSSEEMLESNEDEIVAGTIVFIDASGFVNIQNSKQTIQVYFTDDASFARGKQGMVSGVNAYELGDKVVADGVWEGEIFRAHTLMSIYQLVEGTVTARTENSLLTTGGTLLLIPETTPTKGYIYTEKPLSQIAVGDDIGALTWQEPEAKDHFALRIGVAEKHSP